MLDEFSRSGTLQERFLRQCQREFPKAFRALEDEVARLQAENDALRSERVEVVVNGNERGTAALGDVARSRKRGATV